MSLAQNTSLNLCGDMMVLIFSIRVINNLDFSPVFLWDIVFPTKNSGSRIISEDSLVISTALFIEIPTSATFNAGASLVPSLIKPVT